MSSARTSLVVDQSKTIGIDLLFPRTIVRKLKLPAATFTVQFGSAAVKAIVKAGKGNRQTLISDELAKALRIPAGVPLQVRYFAASRKLVFGPVIGVLLSVYEASNAAAPFRTYNTFLNETAALCRFRGGIVCAFRHDDIDWENRLVHGWIRLKGMWQQHTLPLPQAIYNRLSLRQEEKSDKIAAFIQRCKLHHIAFFNEQFLNKWHVHQVLSKDSLRHYLPRTIRYQTAHDLKSLLREHRIVYVKPVNGSMGKGIFRISRTRNGYHLFSAAGRGTKHATIESLHRSLSKQTRGNAYLLQQGLLLIGHNQRPADFRVLVQKNRRGEWAVTSLVARIGQNRIVSNIARGGRMVSANQALNMCGPWQTTARPTPQSLKAAALRLARVLEQQLAGHYAEFGIDLGVDVKGQMWLLEVNSKPSKADHSLQIPEGTERKPQQIRPSVRRLFDYASYLGGFS